MATTDKINEIVAAIRPLCSSSAKPKSASKCLTPAIKWNIRPAANTQTTKRTRIFPNAPFLT